MNITIVGIGYVGLANTLLLSQNHNVIALDIDSDKVNSLNKRKTPINDPEIISFLKKKKLNYVATCNKNEAIKDADFIIISTPTNFNDETNYFNTQSVESVIEYSIKINPKALIVVKSTVPVGFTKNLMRKFLKN